MRIIRIKKKKGGGSVKLLFPNKILYVCKNLTAVSIWLETPRPKIFLTEKSPLTCVSACLIQAKSA